MTENIVNNLLEQLNTIRARLDRMEHAISQDNLQLTVDPRIDDLKFRLVIMDSHLADLEGDWMGLLHRRV